MLQKTYSYETSTGVFRGCYLFASEEFRGRYVRASWLVPLAPIIM